MIFIGIGSNLASKIHGSPMKICLEAVKILKREILIESMSPWYESEPVPKSDQPWYINGVLNIKTRLNPLDILKLLLKIESDFGRVREKKNESRVLDLDLLSFKNRVICTDQLIVPHPRMHLRSFVMRPIVDINPDWIHPKLKINARDIIRSIKKKQGIEKIKKID
ncbi:2-amino-4-hydroxy-6-hydroxymethyldihydropteridine diphosphokinase [Rickettsiales bacterium]|nr:2-amino-4-hydroxy-6-hydroxymethyldihydropteridine diphosphokinase [Rickettsiales bacterium]